MNNIGPIIQFTIGIACAVSGVFIMFHGNIFGDNNTGVAPIIGVIGIGLISSSPIGILKEKKV